MEPILIDNIKVELSPERLAKRLRVEIDSEDFDMLKTLSAQAQEAAAPKAVYSTSFIDAHGEDFVKIDGKRIDGRVISRNLRDKHRVFPYLVTCGQEVENWSKTIDDMLYAYWADWLKQEILNQAILAFKSRIKQRLNLGRLSDMNPGSLPDFPISYQKDLFALLGNGAEQAGVRLTDSMLMIPAKSVSGFSFETDADFSNCKLCQRERCMGRRDVFDPELYAEMLHK